MSTDARIGKTGSIHHRVSSTANASMSKLRTARTLTGRILFGIRIAAILIVLRLERLGLGK